VKRGVKWILRVVLGLIIAFIALSILVPMLSMGKGSMRYARKWTQRLDECVTLADVTNRFEYLDVTGTPGRGWGGDLTLLTFTNGDWVVLNTANSHGNPWGGTMITRDSTGRTRVFFGHVCGGETLRGDSLDAAYSNLVSRMERTEVFLDME
jgi:hypothetical protein